MTNTLFFTSLSLIIFNLIISSISFGSFDPNLNLFPYQWSLKNNLKRDHWGNPISERGDISITPVWNEGIIGDNNIIVAIIDTGVDILHPDLRKNIYVNNLEIPNNGIDDDRNGFIDDVNGWNFVSDNNDVSDPHGHGTHVAGIIGADGTNSFGIKGVSWNIQLLPIVYLDAQNRGTAENAVKAIDYAVKMGAKVINSSWGGNSHPMIKEAIERAGKEGVLYVTTPGNGGESIDLFPYYPASHKIENKIVVGSTTPHDRLTGDSNWGKKTVDLLAPGLKILSTLPNNKYDYMSGTSMAAPHVSGASALLLAQYPNWSFREIKKALYNGALDRPDYRNQSRWGRLNIENSMKGIYSNRIDLSKVSWSVEDLNMSWSFEGGHYNIQKKYLKKSNSYAIRPFFENVSIPQYSRVIIEDYRGNAIQKLEGPLKKRNFFGDEIYGEGFTIKMISNSNNENRDFSISLKSIQYHPDI